jgi:hypothetical protein
MSDNMSQIALEDNSETLPGALYQLVNGAGGSGSGSSDTLFHALAMPNAA